jgi:hypothetical protein
MISVPEILDRSEQCEDDQILAIDSYLIMSRGDRAALERVYYHPNLPTWYRYNSKRITKLRSLGLIQSDPPPSAFTT